MCTDVQILQVEHTSYRQAMGGAGGRRASAFDFGKDHPPQAPSHPSPWCPYRGCSCSPEVASPSPHLCPGREGS